MAYDDPNDDDEDKLLSSYLDSYATDARPQLDYAPAPDAAPSTIAPEEMAAATKYGDALQERRDSAYNQYLQSAASPTESSPDVGGKIGQFLGDNAVGILGTLLDAGLNKGRNIPMILTQNAAAQNQAIDQRRADEDRSMAFQLQAQKQRADAAKGLDAADRDQAYKAALQRHWAAGEDAQRSGLEFRGRRQDLLEKKFAVENDPNHPAVLKLKDALIKAGADPVGLDGATLITLRANPAYKEQIELFYKEQGIPIAARTAAATSAAGTGARIDTELSRTPAVAASEEQIAAARAKGGAVGGQEGKVASDQTIDANRLLDANPQLTAADPTLVQQAVNKGTKDVVSQIQTAGRSANIIQGMYDIKHKFNALAGQVARGQISPVDAMSVAAALTTEWHGHAEEFAGAMQKIAGQSSDSGKRAALDLVPSLYSPFGDDRLMGLWGTINENIKSNLGVYSITATPPTFMSTPEAQRVHGMGGHGQPGSVPARPARPRPAARPPAAATPAAEAKPYAGYTATKNADGTYTVRAKDGRVKPAPAAWVESTFGAGGGLIQ